MGLQLLDVPVNRSVQNDTVFVLSFLCCVGVDIMRLGGKKELPLQMVHRAASGSPTTQKKCKIPESKPIKKWALMNFSSTELKDLRNESAQKVRGKETYPKFPQMPSTDHIWSIIQETAQAFQPLQVTFVLNLPSNNRRFRSFFHYT